MSCDCNNGCGNPCGCTTTNTAANESLPSQLENFTTQFFGTIQKTELNGVVSWILPCNLDVGLPANPRAADEGLACYFLRLFNDGIVGLKGDPGTPGATGAPGANSYTVTLATFVQPTLGSPNVQVLTAYNPSIVTGEYLFIQSSGWYLINATDGAGTLFLTLVAEVSGATGNITAGKLAVPTGPPGNSVVGPQGLQGPQGDPGTPGASFTATKGFFYDPSGGTDFVVTPGSYQAITFVNAPANVLLPAAGTYLVSVITSFIVGSGAIASPEFVRFKLRNTSTSVDVPGSEHDLVNIFADQSAQVVLQAHVTVSAANETIALYVNTDSGNTITVPYNRTTISYVRIA